MFKTLHRTIGAGVVHGKKVANPQRAMMRQELRQAPGLVAHAQKAQHRPRHDCRRAIRHRGKLTPTAKGAPEQQLAPRAQLERKKCAGQTAGRVDQRADGAGMRQAPGKG